MPLFTVFSLQCVDIWHYADLWNTATWRNGEGDSDILWSCEHWQWSVCRVWGWRWSVVWDQVERRSVACQLWVWLCGNWLQQNSKQQLLILSPFSHACKILIQNSSFTVYCISITVATVMSRVSSGFQSCLNMYVILSFWCIKSCLLALFGSRPDCL